MMRVPFALLLAGVAVSSGCGSAYDDPIAPKQSLVRFDGVYSRNVEGQTELFRFFEDRTLTFTSFEAGEAAPTAIEKMTSPGLRSGPGRYSIYKNTIHISYEVMSGDYEWEEPSFNLLTGKMSDVEGKAVINKFERQGTIEDGKLVIDGDVYEFEVIQAGAE